MKKRIAVICALVSFLPLGQSLVIGTVATLTSTAVMLAVPEKAQAESSDFYYERGLKNIKSGDFDAAISNFNKVIEKNPRDADAYVNRGYAKHQSSDLYGAISDFNKAIEIDPRNAISYNNLGWSKNDLKDYKGAIVDLNRAIDINPKYGNAFYNRGRSKYYLNDAYGAISDFNTAIKYQPTRLDYVYGFRGVAKERIGDMEGACADWRKASSLGDDISSKWVRNQC